MARLVRQMITKNVDAAGKRVPPGTPGSKKVRTKSAKYYGVGVPGLPPKKRVPLAKDKLAAQRMLDQMVRDAEQGRAGLPDKEAIRLPLADHLVAFETALGLGSATRLRGRAGRPPSPAQVVLIVQRVRDLLAGCGFVQVSDLNADAPDRVSAYLRGRIGKPRAEGGISAQTATFFLSDGRRFVWWLSHRRKAGVRADLFDDVMGFQPGENRVHARRALPPEDVAKLLAAALTGRKLRGLTGADRYHLYLTAFSVGFRVKELAALTPESFDIDKMTVSLGGRRTKNKKAAAVPINPGVMAQLAAYLAGKPAGQRLWRGTWVGKSAVMLRRDLKSAGIPYAVEGPNGPEYADFHALRHSFVSALAAAGVGPKELQELARHSNPRLTLGLYTHTSRQQLTDAVGRVTIPGVEKAEPAPVLERESLEALAGVALALMGWLFAGPGVSRRVSEKNCGDKPL